MRHPNHYHKMLTVLHKLKTICPHYTMGKHISSIVDECGDVFNVTDKELATIMVRYAKQLCMDKPHPDKDIDNIIDEGMHLSRITAGDEYDDSGGEDD